MKAPFVIHEHSHVNDGHPSPYSREQVAIDEAFVKFHEEGGYEWTSFTVEKLPCNDRDSHYPDLCYHFRVTINKPDPYAMIDVPERPTEEEFDSLPKLDPRLLEEA